MVTTEILSFNEFVDNFLEEVTPEQITDENRDKCPGCWRDFGERDDEGLIEPLVRFMKCGHIMGRPCFQDWFVQCGNTTCPFCRAQLYRKGESSFLHTTPRLMSLRLLSPQDSSSLHGRIIRIDGATLKPHVNRVMMNYHFWPAAPEFEVIDAWMGAFGIMRWVTEHNAREFQGADLELHLMLAAAQSLQFSITISFASTQETANAIENRFPGVGQAMLLLIHTTLAFAAGLTDVHTLILLRR